MESIVYVACQTKIETASPWQQMVEVGFTLSRAMPAEEHFIFRAAQTYLRDPQWLTNHFNGSKVITVGGYKFESIQTDKSLFPLHLRHYSQRRLDIALIMAGRNCHFQTGTFSNLVKHDR